MYMHVAPGDHSAVGSDSMRVKKKKPIFNGTARPLPVLRFTSRMVENDRVEEKAIFGPCCVFPFWTPKSPFLHTSTPSPPKIFLLKPHAALPNHRVIPRWALSIRKSGARLAEWCSRLPLACGGRCCRSRSSRTQVAFRLATLFLWLALCCIPKS